MNRPHKIVPLSDLDSIQIDSSKKIVLAGGCFDILHFGHVQFIKHARLAGDVLILLESNEFIELTKKKLPVHTQQQRAEVLAALEYVDYIVLLPLLKNPDKEYEIIVSAIKPSVIAYSEGDSQEAQKKKFAELVSAKTVVIPLLSSFSSSTLITYAPIFRN